MGKKAEEPVEPVADDALAEPATDSAPDGPDPEEFLAQIEARAHKGAAEGFKTALDEWSKQAVGDADLDAIDQDLKEGKNGNRPGGPAGAGRPGQRDAGPPSSIVQDAIAVLIGRPRAKPPT